jgi:2-methylcitrate dehydratase PrpD
MPGFDMVVKNPSGGPNIEGALAEGVRSLAEFAVRTRFEDLPPDVREHARLVLLDTIAVILGGSVEPQVAAMARRWGKKDGGSSRILGYPMRASALNATLVNGTAASWLDFDSGHLPPPGKPLLPAAHPPIHVVPATLAVAEMLKSCGSEVLSALVVGYDTGARIGMASRVRAPIHCHGTHHNVGAAVAAAHLTGVTANVMESAINLAIHLSLMPSFENAYQGGTVRNTYAAVGGVAGILAAKLARAGFTAEHDALGSVYGGIISPWLDRNRLTEKLGQRFEVTRGFIKPYPMCRFGHPALEATEALVRKGGFSPQEIDVVEVHTFDWAASLDDPEPESDLGAKFSVPWAVASMLVKGRAGANEFRNQALDDPDVKAVAAKVKMMEDPAHSAATPMKRPARITLHTRDGRTFTKEVERSGGGPDAPLPLERVKEKFRALADPVIGQENATAAMGLIFRLEEVQDIRELTRFLGNAPLDQNRKN